MQTRVVCISSSTYAEHPIGFEWDGKYQQIAEIIARWRTPDELCFRIVTTSDEHYDLHYNQHTNLWQIDPR